MKSAKLTCIAGLLMLQLSMAYATGQQNTPREQKACTEHPDSCGIVVAFNPPIDDALFVPNEVTVDVPLELRATKVIVSSYPRGTGMGDVPSQRFITIYHFKVVGQYAQ